MSAEPPPPASRRLPRSYWALWAGTLVNRLGTMVQPFFAFYLTGTRGLSVGAAGLVLTVFGAGALFSQVLSGWLADRVGRRLTLTGGMVATAAAMLVLGYSGRLALIVPTMFVLGLAIDVYRPVSAALVADLVPVPDRPRAFGLLFWAVNLGFTGGVLTGGSLAAHQIRWLFWIDALSCVAFGLLVWFAVAEPPQATHADGGRGTFGDVLRDRVMVAYTLITTAYGFVYLQSLLTLPLSVRADGLPPSTYGFVMAANGVIVVALQPLLLGRLGRLDHTRVVATGFALVGVGMGATAAASSFPTYLGAVIVWSVGEIVFTAVGMTIAANLAPAHMRGRYSGTYGSAWAISGLLAPSVGTWLFGLSPTVLWLSCAGIGAAAAAGLLALGPAIRARTPSEPEVSADPVNTEEGATWPATSAG